MNDIRDELLQTAVRLKSQLLYRRALGLSLLPAERRGRTSEPTSPVTDVLALPPSAPVPQQVHAATSASLDDVRAELGECTRCKLHTGRKTIVFGEGNPRAEIVFVGEGPGQEEDLQGRPFVGAAGQLLTDIIVKGIKLRREDVYICNIVKCRPPGNRNPEPDEVAACEPFLIGQIGAIKPRWIIALGNVAVKTLLKTKQGITSIRGTWQTYQGIPLMPTFHPAYLLRNPADKRLVWEDIKQVIAARESAGTTGSPSANERPEG